MTADDSTYLKDLANGSREAFEALYLRHAPLVERFVGSLVRDKDAVDDIVQDVFLNLWNRRRNLSEKTNFSAYLFAASRNAVDDWFRRYAKIKTLSLEDVGADVFARADRQVGSDSVRILEEVNAALARMPQKRREVFLLSRTAALSNAQIASLMGFSEKSVEYHIGRALQELKKVLPDL